MVRLYDYMWMLGPYTDIILPDAASGFDAFVKSIESFFPEYFQENCDDLEESMYYLDELIEIVEDPEFEEGYSMSMDFEYEGMEFDLAVCKYCIPKGMN